ncbi:MAG: UbiA family prenyltransferase [Lewinellaceae bacterium]|nr:UbiA family prenyltransferase [Lewinellaceae bacterium]
MKDYLNLVVFSHTIFALPFAMVGYFSALLINHLSFDLRIFGLVVLCMVFARSAAMAFNRYIDSDIDSQNERTKIREIPSGKIKREKVLLFTILNSLAFIATTYFINHLCFVLSPVALLVVLGYSYTKRFTWMCHIVLGIGLGLAPVGAYVAVAGSFNIVPIFFGLTVICWVSGFDIIYAMQDEEFDSQAGLNSIPVWLGGKRALQFSSTLHFLSLLFLGMANYSFGMQTGHFYPLHWIGFVVFAILLIYQHRLVSPDDLSKVNRAFFTTNGYASLIYGLFFIVGLFVFVQ